MDRRVYTWDVTRTRRAGAVNRSGTGKRVYLTYSEPSANGGSGLALAVADLVARKDQPTGMVLDGLKVIWRDPAGGQGGQFGARIAFAPDAQSIFLSSGERQRFTPAQDMSQPLGKILHLTLDGRPARGNPWAGKQGSATVQVTDPPEDSEAARTASGKPFRWPGALGRGGRCLSPVQPGR